MSQTKFALYRGVLFKSGSVIKAGYPAEIDGDNYDMVSGPDTTQYSINVKDIIEEIQDVYLRGNTSNHPLWNVVHVATWGDEL